MHRYYPFELHCHTLHSDGSMSPSALIENAKKRGYAGIAITDHNTYSGVEETFELGRKQGLVVLKGIEWTTFYGHITAIGNEKVIDWREINKVNIDEILEKTHKAGLITTIAHPKRYGAPICKGCHMELPITKYEYITAFEVWTEKRPNSTEYNKKALEMYDDLLEQGYKIAAVYGYDWHREDESKSYAFTFIGGQPQNAETSIKAGDTFVSVGLGINFFIDEKITQFGNSIVEGAHFLDIKIFDYMKPVCTKYDIKAEKIRLIGTAIKNKKQDYKLNSTIDLDLTTGYFRIEIIGDMEEEHEKLLLITSPIFVVQRR